MAHSIELLTGKGQAHLTSNPINYFPMTKTTIPERIALIKKRLGIEEDAAFGAACGMSKSVVNQLMSGKIKTIAPRFAYRLQDKYGINARWLMLGDEPMMLVKYAANQDTTLAKLHLVAEKLSSYEQHLLLKFGNTLAEPKEEDAATN